jgi:hypothetical protein
MASQFELPRRDARGDEGKPMVVGVERNRHFRIRDIENPLVE